MESEVSDAIKTNNNVIRSILSIDASLTLSMGVYMYSCVEHIYCMGNLMS